MSHPVVAPCAGPAWPVGAVGDVVPRPLGELLAEISALPEVPWVEVAGPDPGLHPDLEAVVAAIAARGSGVRLITGGRGLDGARLAGLLARGVRIVRLRLHGASAAVHEAVTDDPFEGVVALLDAVSGAKLEIGAVVTRANAAGLGDLAVFAASRGAELHLSACCPPADAPAAVRALVPGPRTVRAALDAVWRVARQGAPVVRLVDLALPPPPPGPPTAPVPLDPALWDLLRQGVALPAWQGGCTVAGAEPADWARRAPPLADLGHTLAASGCPPVDLPPALGGVAEVAPPAWSAALGPATPLPPWTPAPGRRVAIVVPALEDKLLVFGTLPGLARALRARGADVAWWSAWGPPVPLAEGVAERTRSGAMGGAAAAEAALWGCLDLSDRDVVVVPGFDAAARVLAHPTLRDDARVVVADFHLLHGLGALRAGRVGPAWWPSERVIVHACFPGHVGLYRRAGVPLRQVLWRPYPVDPEIYPSPSASSGVFLAGGNQLRDWATLAAAVRIRRPRHGIDLYTRHAPPAGALPDGLHWRGTVDLPAFLAAVAASRAVIVTAPFDPHRSSGITVAALALAAGRPVVGSRTPGLRDHVRHGVAGLLAEPGDARALADALADLDDDAVLARLAAGARRAGERASVDAWAREILDGAAPARVVGEDGGPWSPW